MNIFEFLGLSKDHRKESKTTQLVKHYDEVIEKHKKDKTFALQLKKDGVCALTVIIHGMVRIFSRTGRKFTNVENLEMRIKSLDLRDGVYMGEMCCPTVSLEVLSGATNPNRVNPLEADKRDIPNNLEMYFFDLVSINSFIEGASQSSFKIRHVNMMERLAECWRVVGVYTLEYTLANSEEDIRRVSRKLILEGEEGMVIRDLNSGWEAGHKGWRVMKLVRGVDYDLICVGWEEGKGKYAKKVANLIFNWKGGKKIKCMLGKGWSHKMAEDMYYAIQSDKVFFDPEVTSPIGKLFQVYALQESSKGVLRLPKVGELRHDKEKPDV